jgi:hypothetical protein
MTGGPNGGPKKRWIPHAGCQVEMAAPVPGPMEGIVRLNTDVRLASPNPILDLAKFSVLLGKTPSSNFQNQSKSAAQP